MVTLCLLLGEFLPFYIVQRILYPDDSDARSLLPLSATFVFLEIL